MQIRHTANIAKRVVRVKIFNSTAGPKSTLRSTQPFTTWTWTLVKITIPIHITYREFEKAYTI